MPSVTETLLSLGVEPVAVTRFCPAPHLARVGGTKNPDIEAIVSLQPDLVILDRQENRIEDAQALEQAGVRLHVTDVDSLAAARAALEGIAALTGVPLTRPRGRDRDGDDTGSPADPDRPACSPIRVFVPIWRRPWMTISAQTYGSDLLSAAGFDNVFADSKDRYPEVTLDEVARLGPEVVLAPSEPYPFSSRHEAELAEVAPVRFVDGEDLFWWGTRTAAALSRYRQLAADLADG